MRKNVFGMVAVIAMSIIITGCKNQLTEVKTDGETDLFSEGGEIILGAKIENPFSIAKARSAGIIEEPNYIYFRCRSMDTEKLFWVSENIGDLIPVPLDYEIVEGGSFYDDPEVDEENECPWFYFMDTTENYQHILEKGLECELIEEMFISEEILSELEESKYDDESLNSRKIFSKGIKKNPSGTITVHTTNDNSSKGVANVKVSCQQLLTNKSAYTDATGYFYISNAFNSKFGKVNMRVTFENSYMTLHGDDASSWTQFITPAYYVSKSVDVSAIDNFNVYFDGSDLRLARLATVMNAEYEYREFATENEITLPPKLRMWVIADMPGAVTLMSRYVLANTNLTMSVLGIPFSRSWGKVIQMFVTGNIATGLTPDIIIGTKDTNINEYSLSITGSVYHESAHASHFAGVGNGNLIKSCNYWSKEWISMGAGWIKDIFEGKDPFDNPYNNSDIVKYVESWGYFTGYYILYKNYFDDNFSSLNDLEYEDSTAPFAAGGLYDLIDDDIEDRDYCSDISVNTLFAAMKDSSIDSLEKYARKISSISGKNYEEIYCTLKHKLR